MSGGYNGITISGGNYPLVWSPDTNRGERPETPSGMIVTQAVQTKEGWLGQVIVDKEIVWESDLRDEGEDAIQKANSRVVEAIKDLFA